MKARLRVATGLRSLNAPYERFREIDGSHDFRDAVPGGYVDYPARNLPGGRVAFFNFHLAKEMGLIQGDHEHLVSPELERAILDAFALQIINEYDRIHGTPIPPGDIRPGRVMATRYLQLQHPDRQGRTSGDGRSIWNGKFSANGVTWDVTSCGTGATRLSPGCAIEKRYFQTNDPYASYGCGTADPFEGFCTALMSEVFRRNGISTERCLAIVEFPDGRSINVRAGRNLLRPSHFFHHLKQGNRTRLRGAIDYFIDRQRANGDWPKPACARTETPAERYADLVKRMAITFGRMAGRFEADYIFVWLDWDGDNILADGGIIDYGSVRQFGLCHSGYRFLDDTRWSTSLPEQRCKARETVQAFAQIADFLTTGRKRARGEFRNHPALERFEREFDRAVERELLRKTGFSAEARAILLSEHRPLVREYLRAHRSLERALSSRGPYRVGDGVTHDPIYDLRGAFRELPKFFARSPAKLPTAEKFHEWCLSSRASRADRKITRGKRARIHRFMALHRRLSETLLATTETPRFREHWFALNLHAGAINLSDRITGESVLGVAAELMRARKRLPREEFADALEWLIQSQTGAGVRAERRGVPTLTRRTERLVNRLLQILADGSESI